ncbi:MAG: RagB/SusD family nutrient uptake outer membrane protein, partial [Bacteroidales bacterium]|nr:RagB/SusD family nutrient uptake outer membrane protein [Bacteroidales bacterium]
MNSIRFLSFAALAIIVFIGFSCSEDFFEATPGDRITPENHYRTAIEIEVSYLGAFRLLQDVAPDLMITNGLLADLVDVTENSDIHLRGINKHEFNRSNPYLDASGLYKVIVQANEVLVNIDTNIQDADFTVFRYNLYQGDLIGLRSWAYFNLARIYGQAAYIPDNLATLPEGG